MTKKELNQTEKEFLNELKELLKQYDAEIELEETARGWDQECSINFFGPAKYDGEGNQIRESININVTYLDGK